MAETGDDGNRGGWDQGPTAYAHVAVVPHLIAGPVVGIVTLARERDEPLQEREITAVRHFGTPGALLVENARQKRAASQPAL